ncbi:MAG: 3-oxoacyl-ACP synthase III [Deltaproteobacteria bacterium]|nr:3-oxoacyl-ACP synthase III [Deltaproteobacteria bacterium]
MRFENVSIASVAHVDAPEELSSAELERRLAPTLERLHIPPGTLEVLTGIQSRNLWPEGVQPSDAATLAAKQALSLARIDRERVGVLINTSVCRDFIEPSTACLVHGKLGLGADCLPFDVGNACLAFLNGMDLVGNMIERGQVDFGLVVDGENCRPVLEATLARLVGPEIDHAAFLSEFATLTLGSGGAAMLLGRRELVPEGHRYLGSVMLAASEHRHLCQGDQQRMVTDARGLLVAGLELAERTYARAQQEFGWDADKIDECVLHQVSRSHTQQLTKTLGIPMEKVLETYPRLGNVGPAGVPIALSMAAEAGRLQPGARVALMGIGSGLNCAMAEVVW